MDIHFLRDPMARTMIDVLQQSASVSDKGFTFLDDHLNERVWSFADLALEVERRARIFRTLGFTKGDRIALIIPEGEDFVLNFFGAVRAGLVPVPMYPPLAVARLDAYVESAARIVRTAKARLLITNPTI